MKLKASLMIVVVVCVLLLIPGKSMADQLLQLSQPQQLGNGDVRVFSFVIGGYPIGMGFTFDASVFDNAPIEPSDGQWDVLDSNGDIAWSCCGHELVFDLPENITKTTAFTHLVMNWNPHGHPPPTIYTVPHIDFHFYNQSRAERESIYAPVAEDMCNDNVFDIPPPVPLSCDQLNLAMIPLPPDQQPPNHVSVGAVEPGMGNHLINPGAPEFQGEAFTHTFIFGSWNGDLTFWEPMIAKDYLTSTNNSCFPIINPASAPQAGWYPSRYCMINYRGQNSYSVFLTAFRWLTASDGN